MNITEVYEKYPVHRGLQEHMVRVAAVAKQICDDYVGKVDRDAVITGCLLHDMGNLLKVKFEVEPSLFEPEGVTYWQKAQEKMREVYGVSVHEATLAIIKDAGVREKVLEIVDEASFDDILTVARSGSQEAKILEYADMRVGMAGIVSLKERFDDIRTRYVPHRFTNESLDKKYDAANNIEQEIFQHAGISAKDINNISSQQIQAGLWDWEMHNE